MTGHHHRNTHSLIRVLPNAILQFDESTYCDNLLSVARSAGKSISEYGVVEVIGEKPHVCKFNDRASVEGAMAALANHNVKLPDGGTGADLLVLERIYKRQ